MPSSTIRSGAYSIRPASPDDLPMLHRWLQTPEIVRWWGDSAREYALLEGDLNEPLMTMCIVSYDERPFAYVQHYAVDSWPQEHFAHLPHGTRAIDAFIGEPDMLGVGHGASFLRIIARALLAEGAPLVVIDPDAANVRARHAYANAGFAGDEVIKTPEGPIVVMTFAGP
jgi:aminoglycoside 6'-N-acetyltransferase